MTREQLNVLLPIRLDIRKKFLCLNKARDMNATPEVLVAIIRKIYEAQDLLISESIKQGVCSPESWFKGR